MANVSWIPLEANPDVLNKYASKLGLKTEEWSFVDVWGLDEELLFTVPQPVVALLFLFPITKESEAELADLILEQKREVKPDGLVFIKQTIPNACGTIGLLHALLNNLDSFSLKAGGKLSSIHQSIKGKTPNEIAAYLEKDEDLAKIHKQVSHEGQTTAPEGDEVDLHFVCFVIHKGRLYELDGRKPFPVDHGEAENLLLEGAKVIKRQMERNPNLLEFNLMALAASEKL